MWRVEMKALSVDQNGKLDVCDVPKPVYGDCQALVKTLSCGVCNGTDMKLIHGSFKNMTHYPMLLLLQTHLKNLLNILLSQWFKSKKYISSASFFRHHRKVLLLDPHFRKGSL